MPKKKILGLTDAELTLTSTGQAYAKIKKGKKKYYKRLYAGGRGVTL